MNIPSLVFADKMTNNERLNIRDNTCSLPVKIKDKCENQSGSIEFERMKKQWHFQKPFCPVGLSVEKDQKNTSIRFSLMMQTTNEFMNTVMDEVQTIFRRL